MSDHNRLDAVRESIVPVDRPSVEPATPPVTWPDLPASKPLDAVAPNLNVYLVIDARPHGQSGGIGWAGTDRDRAHEYARNTGGLVARLPVVGDYRKEGER